MCAVGLPPHRYGAAVDAKLARSMGLKNVGVVEEEDAFGQGVLWYRVHVGGRAGTQVGLSLVQIASTLCVRVLDRTTVWSPGHPRLTSTLLAALSRARARQRRAAYGCCAAAAVSFYFMAYLSAYGGLISEVHAFQPGKGDSQAAVADMLKGKATGLDGVYIATNDLAFLAGEAAATAPAEECRLGLQGLQRNASPLTGDSWCMLAPALNTPVLIPC